LAGCGRHGAGGSVCRADSRSSGGDLAGAHTLDSAFAKGYTSASFKIDTTALVERSKTVPVLANLFKLPHLLLLGGRHRDQGGRGGGWGEDQLK
jgi:hypothetical protein